MGTNLSLREAAAKLGVTYARLMNYVQAKRVPVERIGWQYSIREEDLEQIRAILDTQAGKSQKKGRAAVPAAALPHKEDHGPDTNNP